MKTNEKKKYYLIYSLIFVFVSLFIAYFYISNGKTLINEAGDGYRQNYRALVYYSNYLKTFFYNIFHNHIFSLPAWDFSIGEGSDIFLTFFISELGGPLDFLSVFIPNKYLYLYHDIGIFIRLYLAGIVFSLIYINNSKINKAGLLIASLSYTFCGYAYIQANNFYFFLKPLIEMPLIVLGIEKVLKDDKPLLLIVSVALTLIMNVYTAYSIAIISIIYLVVRLITLKGEIKYKLQKFGKIVLYVLIGVLLSSIRLVPSLFSLLGNQRLNNDASFNLFYSIKDIGKLFTSLYISDHLETLFGGYAIVLLTLLILLFRKKGRILYKVLTIISLIFFLSPSMQRIFNGFTYPTERWVWAIDLLMSCIIAECFNELDSLKENALLVIIINIVFSVYCCICDKERIKIHILLFLFVLVIIFVVLVIKNKKISNSFVVIISILGILLNLYNYYSPSLWNQVANGASVVDAQEYNNNESLILKEVNDDSFWRYTGDSLTTNSSMQNGYYATNFYWSCVNNNVSEFRNKMGLLDHNSFHYDDYNDRTSLISLSSSKYYIKSIANTNVPYNFELINDKDEIKLYQNNSCLPLIYGYNNTFSEETWNTLNPVEKQEIIEQAAVIKNGKEKNLEYSFIDNEYTINDLCDVDTTNNKIFVNKKSGSFDIKTKANVSGEHYVVIEGLYCENIENNKTQFNITISNDETSKIMNYKNTNHQRYSNKHDYVINLGYYNNTPGKINFVFDSCCELTYKSIKYVVVPLNVQNEELAKLDCTNISNLSINGNNIQADINLEKDKYLCFSIPYSIGWELFIDENKVELNRTNIMYMGCQSKKGTHHLELKYHTPLFKEGAIISSITLVGLVIYCIINKKKNNHI